MSLERMKNLRDIILDPKLDEDEKLGECQKAIAAMKDEEIISLLTTKYGEKNRLRDKTLLHIAASNGYEKILGYFLNLPAMQEINLQAVQDWYGNSCLHVAKNSNVVKLLLDKGFSATKKNHEGKNPLHKAVQEGDLESCKLLINASSGEALYQRDLIGFVPIHSAVAKGHKKIVSLFLEKDIRLASIEDSSHYTPIYYADEPRIIQILYPLHNQSKKT